MGKNVCKFHFNYYASKSAIIIQKIYRGYKARKYINNIYIRLPYDVQKIVNFYIREDHYIKKYNSLINNIVSKKIELCLNYMCENINIYNNYNFPVGQTVTNYITFIYNNYEYIEKNFKLYFKYKKVLDKEDTILRRYTIFRPYINRHVNIHGKINILFHFYRTIKISLYYYEKMINNANSCHMFNVVYALYKRLNILTQNDFNIDADSHFID
jgi:hypothetical protein